MPANQPVIAYLIASVLFILSLSGLSRQETARRGNLLGVLGMLIAVGATIIAGQTGNYGLLIPSLVIGSMIGIIVAKRVQMTAMPQLVAILHSFVGLGAVLVGISSAIETAGRAPAGGHLIHQIEI